MLPVVPWSSEVRSFLAVRTQGEASTWVVLLLLVARMLLVAQSSKGVPWLAESWSSCL